MRNWNNEALHVFWLIPWVFTLPMRNWNWSWKKYEDAWLCKFLLYLWGIETNQGIILNLGTLRFYFTYEELKLRPRCFSRLSISAFLLYLWGIETLVIGQKFLGYFTSFYFTYEELKQREKRAPGKKAYCFYFTYEELKRQCTRRRRNIFCKVFTLPMRNWNSITHKLKRLLSRVFTLPMRNWNWGRCLNEY